MRDETKMDVYTSGVTGAEYDAGMKQLMSNKEIIIPILQMTVPEFKTCSQEEILQCLDISSITKDDFVSDIPNVEKDLRLTKEDSELSSLVEKLVRFDIRFKIINPKLSTEKIRVNLHIDMEAQKSYRPSNPSYPILKRAEQKQNRNYQRIHCKEQHYQRKAGSNHNVNRHFLKCNLFDISNNACHSTDKTVL